VKDNLYQVKKLGMSPFHSLKSGGREYKVQEGLSPRPEEVIGKKTVPKNLGNWEHKPKNRGRPRKGGNLQNPADGLGGARIKCSV